MLTDAAERQRIVAEAAALQGRGLIGDGAALPIEDALENEESYLRVKSAVDEYHRNVESSKLAAKSDGRSQAVQPLFRGGSGAAAFAIELARNLRLEAIEGMENFDSRIRAKFAGVPEFSGKNAAVAEALLHQARSILAERIVCRMMSGRQGSAGNVELLPPPLSVEFARAVRRRFKISAKQYEAWTQMPVWNTVLKGLFHRIMADGAADDNETSPLEGRRLEILTKKAWFDDLIKAGVSEKEIKHYFARKISTHGTDSAFRAGGWLRRFIPSIPLSPATAGSRAAVMVQEIEAAHEMAPRHRKRKFMGLLPHLAEKLSAQSVRELLKAQDNPLYGLQVFRADTILLWHDGPPADLANRLLYLIGRNKKYTKLDEFAKNMLGATAKSLLERIEELSTEGIDAAPIKSLIEEKFGGAKSPARKKDATRKEGKEKSVMDTTMKAAASRPGVYKASEGDTLAKVAEKTGADVTALYLQNIWRIGAGAQEYKGPVIERDVVLSFEARRGETVDALARRMRIYPAFFKYQLKQKGIPIEHKQSDSWSWDEFTQDVSTQISVKIAVPVEIAIESGLLLVMPWSEWPLRGDPVEGNSQMESATLFMDTVEANAKEDAEAARDKAKDDSPAKGRGTKRKVGGNVAKSPASSAVITTGASTPKVR